MRALHVQRYSRHLVIPLYVAAALVLTWPLAGRFDSHLPAVGYPFDPLLHVFLLGWSWHGLTTNPLEVFNAPIFHPEVRTLTYMDHMLGEAVVAGPVIELFGLGAGYNCLVVLSFVASGYFVYRLARLYGTSRSGGCAAGFFFAFCPYRFSHLGCLNQLQTQFIPLGIFFAVRFLRTGRKRAIPLPCENDTFNDFSAGQLDGRPPRPGGPVRCGSRRPDAALPDCPHRRIT